MQIWTFLHILSMFAAITVIVGAMLWATWAIRKGDIGALRAYFRVAPQADRLGVILFVAGVIFGLVAAVVIGWDLLVLWLVIAYILVIAIIVLGGPVTTPYLKRVEVALPERDDEQSAQFGALLRSPLPVVVAALSLLGVAAIIAMMVFKPTSF